MIKEDLYNRIKKMNINECWEYRSSAKSINHIIGLIGVGIFLIILFFPNIIYALLGGFFITVLAKISTGIDETISKIEERILILDPDD